MKKGSRQENLSTWIVYLLTPAAFPYSTQLHSIVTLTAQDTYICSHIQTRFTAVYLVSVSPCASLLACMRAVSLSGISPMQLLSIT